MQNDRNVDKISEICMGNNGKKVSQNFLLISYYILLLTFLYGIIGARKGRTRLPQKGEEQ